MWPGQREDPQRSPVWRGTGTVGPKRWRLRLRSLSRPKSKARWWDGLVPEAEAPLRALAGAGWRSFGKKRRDRDGLQMRSR